MHNIYHKYIKFKNKYMRIQNGGTIYNVYYYDKLTKNLVFKQLELSIINGTENIIDANFKYSNQNNEIVKIYYNGKQIYNKDLSKNQDTTMLTLNTSKAFYINKGTNKWTFKLDDKHSIVGNIVENKSTIDKIYLKCDVTSIKVDGATLNIGNINVIITDDLIKKLLMIIDNNTQYAYIEERHIQKIINNERIYNICGGNIYFLSELLATKKRILIYDHVDYIDILMQNGFLTEFIIDCQILTDDNVSKLCINKKNIYKYIDKKLVVNPSNTEFIFIKQDNTNVELPNEFNIIFDTGNDSYTLIGRDIVKYLGLDIENDSIPLDTCGIVANAICTFNQFVNLKMSFKNFSNSFDIKAYIDDNHPKQLLFGWHSGLDQLYENRFVFMKHNNKSLADEILDTKIFLLLRGIDMNHFYPPNTRNNYDVPRQEVLHLCNIMNDNKMTKTCLKAYKKFLTISKIIQRNKDNNTFEMYN